MAKPPRLKVYVTPIGFHDAYVAAASQRAALRAWGTTTDLFGVGRAGLAPEGEGQAAALAEPGTVVRRLRGSEAAMLDFEPPAPADPPAKPARPATRTKAARATPKTKSRAKSKPEPEPKPEAKPPDRAPLDASERALAEAERNLADGLDRIAAEREALDVRAARLEAEGAATVRDRRRARDAARRAYDEAVAARRRGRGRSGLSRP